MYNAYAYTLLCTLSTFHSLIGLVRPPTYVVLKFSTLGYSLAHTSSLFPNPYLYLTLTLYCQPLQVITIEAKSPNRIANI